MSKRMIIMLFLCALVFGIIFGIKALFTKGMNDAINSSPIPASAVTTAIAKEDSWATSLEAVGTVRAVNGVAVTTQIAGAVQKIHFKSGDQVKQGDVLVTLDSGTDTAQLNALRAAAKLGELEYERFLSLHKQGSVSQSELDRKRSERDQATANADAQREKVSQKTLRAPFDGQLGIRQVDLGQYLNPGDAVVTLQQLNPIYVNFSLPEQLLSSIATGLDVQVALAAFPDQTFNGKITAVEPGVEAATRNFNIQAQLNNDDQHLRPGMFADVRIALSQENAVVVLPRTAIAYAPYGNAVYVINDTGEKDEDGNPKLAVKKRFVKLGPIRGDLIAIVDGLKPGEKVASSGLLKLRNDAPVFEENDVMPADDATPNPANS